MLFFVLTNCTQLKPGEIYKPVNIDKKGKPTPRKSETDWQLYCERALMLVRSHMCNSDDNGRAARRTFPFVMEHYKPKRSNTLPKKALEAGCAQILKSMAVGMVRTNLTLALALTLTLTLTPTQTNLVILY